MAIASTEAAKHADSDAASDGALTARILRLVGISTAQTEAKQQSKVAELVEVMPADKETEGTWTHDLKSWAAMSGLVMSFTVLAPAMVIAILLYPFIYGLRSSLPLLTALAACQFIPTAYSRAFVESAIVEGTVRAAAAYFAPFRVLRPAAPLDPSRRYVFAWHPHGRLFVGSGLLQGLFHLWFPELWKSQDLHTGTAPLLLQVPVFGSLVRLLGAISVDRASLSAALRRGASVAVVPGGIEEVLEGTFDQLDVVYLARRKGFCKLAMDHGAAVVPCFCFGENALFQHDAPWRLAVWRWVNRYIKVGVLSPIIGRYYLPIPYSVPLLVVIGEPLVPAHGETLDQFHARYVTRLEELYQHYVVQSAQPHKRLVIH